MLKNLYTEMLLLVLKFFEKKKTKEVFVKNYAKFSQKNVQMRLTKRRSFMKLKNFFEKKSKIKNHFYVKMLK